MNIPYLFLFLSLILCIYLIDAKETIINNDTTNDHLNKTNKSITYNNKKSSSSSSHHLTTIIKTKPTPTPSLTIIPGHNITEFSCYNVTSTITFVQCEVTTIYVPPSSSYINPVATPTSTITKTKSSHSKSKSPTTTAKHKKSKHTNHHHSKSKSKETSKPSSSHQHHHSKSKESSKSSSSHHHSSLTKKPSTTKTHHSKSKKTNVTKSSSSHHHKITHTPSSHHQSKSTKPHSSIKHSSKSYKPEEETNSHTLTTTVTTTETSSSAEQTHIPVTPTTNPDNYSMNNTPIGSPTGITNPSSSSNNNNNNDNDILSPEVGNDVDNRNLGIGLGVGIGSIAAICLAGLLVYNHRNKNRPSSRSMNSLNDDDQVNTRWRTQSFMGVVAAVVAKLPRSGSLRSKTSSFKSYNSNNNANHHQQTSSMNSPGMAYTTPYDYNPSTSSIGSPPPLTHINNNNNDNYQEYQHRY